MRVGDMYLVSEIKIATHHVSSQTTIKYCIFFLTDCHEEVLVHCSNSLPCNYEPICTVIIIQHCFNRKRFPFLTLLNAFQWGKKNPQYTAEKERRLISLLHRQAAAWKRKQPGNSQALAVCVQELPPHQRAGALIAMVTPFHQTKTTQMQRQNQKPNLANVTWAYCWLLKWCQMCLLK